MEKHIIRSSISADRRESFFLDYLRGRQDCAAVEAAFERAGSLIRVADWQEAHGMGFNVVIHKGPFVDGSNYAPFRAWQFALALERFLLKKLEDSVRDVTTEPRLQAEPNWRSMLSVVDSLSGIIGSTDPRHRLILVAGPLHENWLLDLVRRDGIVPTWDLPKSLNKTWILAAYHESLIIHLQDTEERAIHVLDIGRFASLTQFGSARLDLDEIRDSNAVRLLKSRDESTSPTRIRDLTLKVWMRLYESWELQRQPEAIAATARVVAKD